MWRHMSALMIVSVLIIGEISQYLFCVEFYAAYVYVVVSCCSHSNVKSRQSQRQLRSSKMSGKIQHYHRYVGVMIIINYFVLSFIIPIFLYRLLLVVVATIAELQKQLWNCIFAKMKTNDIESFQSEEKMTSTRCNFFLTSTRCHFFCLREILKHRNFFFSSRPIKKWHRLDVIFFLS